MDRLKALLGDQPARQRDKDDSGGDSRERERSILNHADAKYNKAVYENEKRQANLYEQSQMPESSKDVGVSFKIGSFVNKISQLLSFKNDLYSQLQALINLGTSPSRLLTDSRLISIATDYFKMTDIIANFNELVNYINLYAPQMKSDEDFKTGVNTTYLLPLIALLDQTAELYVAGYNQFPNKEGVLVEKNKIDRDAYERMRNASALAYSTIMLMKDNLKNAIYQPITKQAVEKYESDKGVRRQTFNRNPFPVVPVQDPLAQQQQQQGAPAQQQQQQQQQQQGAPAQTGRLPQADISQVLTAIANEARQTNRVPYYSDATKIYDATDFGTRGLRVKGVVAQIVGDVREALGLARNTKPSAKNDQISSQAYASNQAYFQDLAQGQPPQELIQLAGFQSRVAPQAPTPPASPQQQPAPAPVSPVIQPAPAPPSPPQQGQQGQAGPAPAGFNSLVDIPAIANGGAQVQAIAQLIIDNERRNGALFDERDPKDLAKILAVMKQTQPQLYTTLRDRDVANGGQPLGDDLIMSDEIDPVMRNIRLYKEGIGGVAQMNPFNGVEYQDVDSMLGLGRRPFEARKLLAERARGDPRVVDMSQGRARREKMMPFINEFSAPAEFLKRRGEVMAGGIEYGVNENINDLLPYEMYGGNVDMDDAEEQTPFKRRIGMPNPFAYKSKMDTLPIRPVLASNATDIDETLLPFQQMFSTARSGHAKEQEKPKDMDENPDPIRITNENYKIFTGKQKAPKYKIS